MTRAFLSLFLRRITVAAVFSITWVRIRSFLKSAIAEAMQKFYEPGSQWPASLRLTG